MSANSVKPTYNDTICSDKTLYNSNLSGPELLQNRYA